MSFDLFKSILTANGASFDLVVFFELSDKGILLRRKRFTAFKLEALITMIYYWRNHGGTFSTEKGIEFSFGEKIDSWKKFYKVLKKI